MRKKRKEPAEMGFFDSFSQFSLLGTKATVMGEKIAEEVFGRVALFSCPFRRCHGNVLEIASATKVDDRLAAGLVVEASCAKSTPKDNGDQAEADCVRLRNTLIVAIAKVTASRSIALVVIPTHGTKCGAWSAIAYSRWLKGSKTKFFVRVAYAGSMPMATG